MNSHIITWRLFYVLVEGLSSVTNVVSADPVGVVPHEDGLQLRLGDIPIPVSPHQQVVVRPVVVDLVHLGVVQLSRPAAAAVHVVRQFVGHLWFYDVHGLIS